MRRERRQPTRRELGAATSKRPVVRRIRPADTSLFARSFTGLGEVTAADKKGGRKS